MGEGADAYVQGSAPNENFGSSTVITTRDGSGNSSNVYKDYFRFDLSDLDGDFARAISVTFKFVSLTARGGVSFDFYLLLDGLPADASPQTTGWTESGINYNNAPGNVASGSATGFITSSPGDENGNYLTYLGSVDTKTSVGTTVSFSSAALLKAVQNDTNGFLTLAIRRSDPSGIVQLASKENVGGYAPPTLVIDAPKIPDVPEPSTFGLVALGAFLIVRWNTFRQRWK